MNTTKQSKSSGHGNLSDLVAVLEKMEASQTYGPIAVSADKGELKRLQELLNGMIESVDAKAQEARDMTLSLAMSISEVSQVLTEVRNGNLSVRISETALKAQDPLVAGLARLLNETVDEIKEREALRFRQQIAIEELSTPILKLWDGVLVLPVIGVVDSRRSMVLMEKLLDEIVATQSQYVIIDVTGVVTLDTQTASHFIKLTRAAALLGTRCMLTGIRPAVAQALVAIDVDLSVITTKTNLQAGLRECLNRMGVLSAMPSQGAAIRASHQPKG